MGMRVVSRPRRRLRGVLFAAAALLSISAAVALPRPRPHAWSRYPHVDTTIDPTIYNCAGLAFRNYRAMTHEQVRAVLARARPLAPAAPAAPRTVKVWYWEYDACRRTAADTQPRHHDYHMVAGLVGPDGKGPLTVYSKNGLRPLKGPASPALFRPLPEEDLGLNASGRAVTQVRYNIIEQCYELPLRALPD